MSLTIQKSIYLYPCPLHENNYLLNSIRQNISVHIYTHAVPSSQRPEHVMNSLTLGKPQRGKYQILFRARSQRASLNCVHYGSEYIIYGLLKNTCLDSSDSNMTDVERRTSTRATAIRPGAENKSVWMLVWCFIITICRFQSLTHTHKETKTSNLTCLFEFVHL